MAVYYKFKSAKDFDSVPIDGHFISVANLKEKIFETKHLGRGTDFDLMVSNAQTNQEYPDEDMLIPKNTSVLVRRVPGQPRKPIVTQREETKALENKEVDSQPANSSYSAINASGTTFPEETEWDEFGNDLYAIPDVLPVHSSNPVEDAPPPNRADEDSKIKALIDTPALDWQQQVQDGFGAGRGFARGMGGRMIGGRGFGRGILERKTPPPGYICHRCKVPGHFIQHCPTNGDPNYDVKKTKPPTGIPRSMLVPTPDGSYALPSGAVAVLKPNEAAFEKEIEGLPSTRPVADIPPELRCPLCKEVMQDAVLTSKCCFQSFCDKCIRNHIISKLACVCGASNVLADDLLPNKTVRETISRFLESNNSIAENAGSMLQVQDMESARPAQPKVLSPTLSAVSKGGEPVIAHPAQLNASDRTLSATSKGDQQPPSQKDLPSDVKESANDANDTGAPQLTLGTGRVAKTVDASEPTLESMTVKEPVPQTSAPLAEEEVQQKPSTSELGKKKKKKKPRLPPNDLQWRTPQDMAAENYMMPFPPSYDPYWGNMHLGMDGYMNPYGGTMPYMGYVPGPFDVPMGPMLPQDPFGAQGYMMPVVPPQRDLPSFPVGSNQAPPFLSRAEYEARKADLRRRGVEGRIERAAAASKDQESGRDVSSNGDISSVKSKHRMMYQNRSPDHRDGLSHHHQGERESSLDHARHHRAEKEDSLERVHHHRVDKEDSLERGHHNRHRSSHYRRDERETSPERPHSHHRHHRRTESPSRDLEPVRHARRRSDHNDLPPHDREPARKRRSTAGTDIETEKEGKDCVVDFSMDKKPQKASVFSRISFPGELGGNKKRKDNLKNGYNDPVVHHKVSSTGGVYGNEKPSSMREIIAEEDHDSSDEERHFKRRPSRYEPPPAPIEWEEEDFRHSRSSRERGHKHR